MKEEGNNQTELSDCNQLTTSRTPLNPLLASTVAAQSDREGPDKKASSSSLVPSAGVPDEVPGASQNSIMRNASVCVNNNPSVSRPSLATMRKLRRGCSERCLKKTISCQQPPLRRSASFARVQGELKGKWQRVKARLRFLSKMTKINEKLINYGTSRDLFDLTHRNALSVRNNLDPVIKPPEVHDRFLFRPDSWFISVWSLLLIVLMMYTAYVMPYKLAFLDTTQGTWFYIELTVDCLFMTDVLVNFNTACETPSGVLETSRRTIAINYLTGWFFIDVVASIPADLVESLILGSSQLDTRVLRLARLPRLYRLIRATRLFKLSSIFKEGSLFGRLSEFFQVNAGLLRLFSFMLVAVTCIHIMGCFWYYFAKIDDLGPDTWVVRFGLQDSGNATIYLASVYWAVQTMLTVGYGDIHAYTTSICFDIYCST